MSAKASEFHGEFGFCTYLMNCKWPSAKAFSTEGASGRGASLAFNLPISCTEVGFLFASIVGGDHPRLGRKDLKDRSLTDENSAERLPIKAKLFAISVETFFLTT